MKDKLRSSLRPLRNSLVSDGFKIYKPGWVNSSKTRLYHKIELPADSAITFTNNVYTSPQLIQNFAEELKKDVDYVKLIFDHTLGTGTVRYYISNDATNYSVEVLTTNATYRLPRQADALDNYQTKFNDLRVRIVKTGDAAVNSLKIFYSLR